MAGPDPCPVPRLGGPSTPSVAVISPPRFPSPTGTVPGSGHAAGVDPDSEAFVLLMLVTGPSQRVLDGQVTGDEAFATIDYALNRVLRKSSCS